MPHGESRTKLWCYRGVQGEIISPPNRKEAHKVGVGGGGFQNTTNRYSLLSNYIAALLSAVLMSVGTSSASHSEQVGDISHLSPRGHGQVADGASGTSFFLFWWVVMRVKYRDIIKGFSCAGQVHTSAVGMEDVLFWL